ncbi:MAG: hypothetical protein K1000chlam2_00042 [Chlamydiae bacterium]|nr:hypothetical protein [Chlamydiota bacterium]
MTIEPNNYTAIPNVVFDYWMNRLSHTEFKTLCTLCRKIFGWHKTSDFISVRQLTKATGMAKQSIISSLKNLEERGLVMMIKRERNGCPITNEYRLNIEKPLDEKYQDALDQEDQRTEFVCPNFVGGGPTIRPGVVQPLDQGVVQPLDHQKKDYPKERLTKEREGASAPKPPISVSPPQKIPRNLHIHTTDVEHEKLLNSFGEDRVKSLYELLSEWKMDTPKSKWKKSDYRSILRWVNDALNDRELKKKKQENLDAQESNVDHAQRIAEEFNAVRGPQRQVQLTTTQDSLVIYTTHPTSTRKPFTIKFKENAFQEQVHSALRKWGLL